MRTLSKMALVMLALIAVRMAGRALKANAEVTAALWAVMTITALATAPPGPKAKSTEQRLNALVPVIFPNTGGTVNGSMTVTGNHTVNGNVNVGGYIAGASGGALENTSGIHTAGSLVADGTFSAGNLKPGQSGGTTIFPIATGTPWENQIITGLNALVSALQASGIVT